MRSFKIKLLVMVLRELKTLFKVIAYVAALLGLLNHLGLIDLNPQIPFEGFELIAFAIVPYGLSVLFAYLSNRYASKLKN